MERNDGTRGSRNFALTTDPTGNIYIYCEQRSCPWLKHVTPHASLYSIERLTRRHTHQETTE